MAAVRYRQGLNETTGRVLSGPAHLAQSLAKIWRTRLSSRIMLLDYGSDLRGLLGEDITPALALTLYNELAESAARWEPEYAINSLQLVKVNSDGLLGIRHSGIYYPEGRLGNYDIAVPLTRTERSVAS